MVSTTSCSDIVLVTVMAVVEPPERPSEKVRNSRARGLAGLRGADHLLRRRELANLQRVVAGGGAGCRRSSTAPMRR